MRQAAHFIILEAGGRLGGQMCGDNQGRLVVWRKGRTLVMSAIRMRL